MDYELAEELHKTGFKPKNVTIAGSILAIQTTSLSELMEACGDGFDTLYRTNGRWYAIGYTGAKRIDIDGIELDCNSPEEAVARLWLELNK